MRLTKLTLKNFRCFESFEITLHPELTVLIAPNGSGKSTVLDAARVALSPFVKGFDLGSQIGKSASIQIDDVRLAMQENGNMEAQRPASIMATGTWNAALKDLSWVQTRKRIKSGTNTLADVKTKKLTEFAKTLEEQVRAGNAEVTLPLVSYLGTSRLWFEGRFSSVAKDVALDTSSFSRYARSSGLLGRFPSRMSSASRSG